MKVKVLLICVVFAFMSHAAYAQVFFIKGSDLVEDWREYKKLKNAQERSHFYVGFFMGYVVGVADAKSATLALPETVIVDQLCDIVGKYLEAHPEQWRLPGNILVERALLEAFAVENMPDEKPLAVSPEELEA